MGSPQDNDAWNAKYAVKYGAAVIALNYAKAPKNPFPGPIHVSDWSKSDSYINNISLTWCRFTGRGGSDARGPG